jgi:hypothetical protein
MDTSSVLTEIEATLSAQLELASGDPAVEAAGRAVLAALEPAIRGAAVRLAEQAALEIDAQLPDGTVEVTLREGEPMLVVRRDETGAARYRGDQLDARLTVRLPESLKDDLERAASSAGDSINSYVIKALASEGGKRGRKRIQGTFET